MLRLFFLFLLIVLAVSFAAFKFGVFLESGPRFSYQEKPVYSHGLSPKSLYDAAYTSVREPNSDKTRSAIVAHHLIVADGIAAVFEQLATVERRTVVLISPNHFSRGNAAAQISYGSWMTPYGVVETDRTRAELLERRVAFLRHEETAAPEEHGVGVLTPFV
ncbi:AmmeMemoRadiSam system protein B, partial [Candidatus Uhrbacteria bacterium]|nr:AmmeMemoRadiSam system protein B [Candidatus Uhrbacteria bacterium]